MLTILRILIIVPMFILAFIGIALLLILWDIRQHPLSVFHWINLLR